MSDRRQMKSAARLYAVQALFQMEANDQDLDSVLGEFETHRFGEVRDGVEFADMRDQRDHHLRPDVQALRRAA